MSKPVWDKLDKILKAINFTKDQLETKIGEVAEGLNLLRDDHKKLAERVSQTEHHVQDPQPKVDESQTHLHELTDRIRYIEGRAEDMKGWAQCSILWLVGLQVVLRGLTRCPS